MPRGGRRPGAGAPADNLNALRHGRRSRQLRGLFVAATRGGARRTIAKVLDAALLHMAGLVKRRRRKAP
ncbi:MAG TPA: hypothetical protein VII57_06025 [Dehalococcoidia bacterium]